MLPLAALLTVLAALAALRFLKVLTVLAALAALRFLKVLAVVLLLVNPQHAFHFSMGPVLL